MSFTEGILRYLRETEKLVVVTATLSVGGIALHLSEKLDVFDFAGLPVWSRPLAQIIWTLATIHVVVRAIIAIRPFLVWVAGYPQRRSQKKANKPIIDRLYETNGIAREVLCYALFGNDRRFGADEDSHDFPWLIELRTARLIRVVESHFRIVVYEVNGIAWDEMKRHPDKFVNQVQWPRVPWSYPPAEANKIINGE